VTARHLRALAAGVVATLVVLGSVALATAQQSSFLLLRGVDSIDATTTKLNFIWTGDQGALADVKITANGNEASHAAPVPLSQLTEPPKIRIALVVDTGPAMDKSGALVAAKEAAKQIARDAAADGVEVAIYKAGDKGEQVQNYTSDEARLLVGLDRLVPSQGSAVWSAMQQAGGSLANEPTYQGNVVAIVGDNDATGTAKVADASGAILNAGAAVFGLEYTGAGYKPEPLDGIVAAAGGRAVATTDPAAMGPLVTETQRTIVDQQYQVQFDATTVGLDSGQVADITLAVGGQTTSASVVLGGSVRGAQALNPTFVAGAGGIGFLQSGLGLFLTVVLVLIAGAMLAYAITLLVIPSDTLSATLQPYAEGYGGPDELEEGESSLAKSALVQRAVEITEQVAESQGYLARTEAALERANLPLRAGEALFFYIAMVVLVTVVFLAVLRNLLGGIVFGIVAAVIPVLIVNFLASRRRRQFMAQLPDTLSLLSGTLRAGYSLMQGVEAVAQEVPEPMGLELRRVVTEARLGRPLEESLEGTAERMDSADFAWVVMAIRIQREVGGNLAELLLTVSETMTARERLRRDVRTLTAEGRMSAIVLGLLPIGLGLIMYVINPEYTGQLFRTTLGLVMLGAAVVSMLIGFFWMKKIIDIEI